MNRVCSLAVGAISFAMLGCNTQAKWTYPLDPGSLFQSDSPAKPLTIAVLPFRESRPVLNREATRLFELVPLMPFGWMEYNRPEAANQFVTIGKYDFDVDEDLGKAAARSVEDSRLFHRVYFTLGGDTREADFLLRGDVRAARFDGKVITYGLSVFGAYLWLLGLPIGTSETTIEVELSLEDREQKKLWTFRESMSDSVVIGLYYNQGADMLGLSAGFGRIMNDALADLHRHIADLTPRPH